jgi:tRNA nucleotidyltransferase (CCA-adding enzyme)
MTITMFKVGGCVRDEMLGLRSKDIDFAVEAPSFDAMHDRLVADGFELFLVTPEFFTIRARFPRDHDLFGRTTADFVLCRRDGPSSDGRRPDFVEPGSILDDLARRDFTVNAIASNPETGEIIDPHDGIRDLNSMTLRAVGDAMTRFREDGLRALRAIRFVVTKDFRLDAELAAALRDPETARLLGGVSTERIRDELHKAFAADTLGTLDILASLPTAFTDAIFRDGLRLRPTLEKL